MGSAITYLLVTTSVYSLTGSVNEWLNISEIGPLGDGHWSVLSRNQATPMIARALGIDSPEGWRAMTLMIAVVSTGLLLRLISEQVRDSRALSVILIVVVFSPSIRVVFNGQADYDGLTLICLSAILFARSKLSAVILGLILGITSPEQGAFAVLLLIVLSATLDKQRLHVYSWALVSVIASVLTNRWMLRDESIQWPKTMFHRDIEGVLKYIPHFYAGGAVVIAYLLWTVFRQKGLAKALLVGLILFAAPAFALAITSDGSRNFAPILLTSAVLALLTISDSWTKTAFRAVVFFSFVWQAIYILVGGMNYEPQFPTVIENLIL